MACLSNINSLCRICMGPNSHNSAIGIGAKPCYAFGQPLFNFV
nr:MAG TPA: hypothetical protein [Caudoviricetes sp.]